MSFLTQMPASTAPRPQDTAVVRMRRVAARALTDVVDLAAPSTCVGCARWGPAWCDACDRTLTGCPRVVATRLGPAAGVRAAEPFEGPLRRAVSAFKDDGRVDAGSVLTRLARSAVAEAVASWCAHWTTAELASHEHVAPEFAWPAMPDPHPGRAIDLGAATTRETTARRSAPPGLVLVPVPSSRAAHRVRGRFPLGELAAGVRAGTSINDGACLLRHHRRVRDQAGLGLSARRANVEGAFGCDARMADVVRSAGALVIVLDDVVTSGATLGAAHDALEAVGIQRIVHAVIAATPAR